MKRLCIYVTYDHENRVDDYIGYMLRHLRNTVDTLVVVCNYQNIAQGMSNVKPYADRICYRENKGFDAGAYKEFFLNFMPSEDLEQWDEVLLFNDTFYGPLVPWEVVFKRMEKEEGLDFWGLSRYNEDSFSNKRSTYPSHIQSYFLVCRKSLLSNPCFLKFWNGFDYTINRREATEQFEIRFSVYFTEKGFIGKAYTEVCDKNIEMEPGCISYIDYPYELLSELRFPVIKKQAITVDNFKKARKALDYIEKNTNYDMNLIYKHLTRLAQENRIVALFNPIRLEMFCIEHKRIFIYGHGKIGTNLAEFFDYKGWNFEGFLVSEKSEQKKDVFCYYNMKFSRDDGIILALGRKAYQEVFPVVKKDLQMSQLFLPY